MTRFEKYADFAQLLQQPDFSDIIDRVKKQARSKPIQDAYKNHPEVFKGDFLEWFGKEFLNYFGKDFNLHGVALSKELCDTAKDYGIDAEGKTTTLKPYHDGKISGHPGAPVFIQMKYVEKSSYEFTANDEYGITNFITHASMRALVERVAYKARKILFTTAKGIHFNLNEMCFGCVEVVNGDMIKKKVKDNFGFLNMLREKNGLAPISVASCEIDFEAYQLREGVEE
jgi:hypothetical protein